MRTLTIEIEDIKGFMRIKANFGKDEDGNQNENNYANRAIGGITLVLNTLTSSGPIIQTSGEDMEEKANIQMDILRSGDL